jgi:hypothetical protein
MPQSRSIAVGILLFALASSPSRAFAQPYRAIDLGTLPGRDFTVPTDINNQLQIVGTSGDQAVLWDATGIHPLGVTTTSELRINNNGAIAGVRTVNGRQRPFVWINGSTFEPAAPAEDIQAVRALTDTGLLLMQGTSSYLLWAQTLYNLTTIFNGEVFALNQSGMLVGIANRSPFLRFPDGRIATPWTAPAAVTTIGPAGHFAGFNANTIFQQPWYYGTPDGTVTTIQPLVNGNGMALGGINRAGDLVGHISQSGGRFVPFLYRGGTLINLNTVTTGLSGWQLLRAVAINDTGYIVATAALDTSFQPTHAFLLVPAAPAAPTGVTFSVTVRPRVVTLQWQASPGANNYIVEAGSAPGASNFFSGAVGSGLSISAAVPPGRYYVRVRAQNAAGVSEPSTEVVIDVL